MNWNDCELTKEQLKTTNGCGSSYWIARPFRIPDWVGWRRVCNRHDYLYSIGNTMMDKWIADDELYNAMMYDAFNNSNWFTKPIKIKLAEFTYWCISTKLSDKCFTNAKI